MNSTREIKIGIVDSSAAFRKGLINLLSSAPFKIAFEVADDVEMIKRLSIGQTDILLYDLFNSTEQFDFTAEDIRRANPEVKIVVLSFDHSQELIQFCFSNGVSGFFDKSVADYNDLAESLIKIHNGETLKLVNQLA